MKARARLEARRTEIETQSTISAESRDTVTLDQQAVGRLSRMDALQQQAMAAANERARAGELARIKAAMARIDEDEYGYCVTCGEEIPDQRLAIDPTAATCVKCAK